MATDTRAELGAAFDYLGEGGLDDFEPEAPRAESWLRVASPGPADLPRWEPFVAPRPAPRSWPLVVPVVAAAVLAGAVMSWVGLGAGRQPVPPPLRFADPPFVRETVTPAVTPVETAPSSPNAAPARASSPAVAPSPAVDPALQETLARVAQAYRSLDASSLTAVWPGVDTARLADAFSGLKYQSLTFDRCQLRPNGPESTVASCDVSIAAAAKDGDPALQRRHEAWMLVLNRLRGGWQIAGLTTD